MIEMFNLQKQIK